MKHSPVERDFGAVFLGLALPRPQVHCPMNATTMLPASACVDCHAGQDSAAGPCGDCAPGRADQDGDASTPCDACASGTCLAMGAAGIQGSKIVLYTIITVAEHVQMNISA